jgi:hypothetical protein
MTRIDFMWHVPRMAGARAWVMAHRSNRTGAILNTYRRAIGSKAHAVGGRRRTDAASGPVPSGDLRHFSEARWHNFQVTAICSGPESMQRGAWPNSRYPTRLFSFYQYGRRG